MTPKGILLMQHEDFSFLMAEILMDPYNAIVDDLRYFMDPVIDTVWERIGARIVDGFPL